MANKTGEISFFRIVFIFIKQSHQYVSSSFVDVDNSLIIFVIFVSLKRKMLSINSNFFG